MRRSRVFFLCLLTLAGIALSQPANWPDPSQLTFDLLSFNPPEPARTVLSNGVVVYLAEDHSLPLINGVAYVNARAIFDPADKVGLAGLTASLLREGGAGDLSPDALDRVLEQLAATVETDSNDFFSSVSFSALADNVDQVLGIWRDVLINPQFDAGRLEVERQRQLESIRRIVDNPVQLAVREFYFRLAEGHPSGFYATADTVDAITRDDVISFHQRFYQPTATIVAITGDFDSNTMIDKLEATLGSWQGQPVDYPQIPAFNPNPAPKIYYAPKDIAQSIILVGHPSVTAYSDAYNDLDVANEILGAGGFSSRLFTEIRTKRGFAYSTGSFITQGFDYPGDFVEFSISRAERTGEVIELLLSEVNRLQQGGVTQAELEQSRQTILNQSLFRFTSVAAVTQRTARVELLGLQPGYYENYLSNVQSITPDRVQAAAQQFLRPDDFIIMVVGNQDLFDRPLSDFGEVVTIDLQ